MASIVRRGNALHVRFYYRGRQYWKSLKTNDRADAKHARAAVERAIHLLETGALTLPPGQDPVTLVVSGGQVGRPKSGRQATVACARLRDLYLEAARPRRAPSTFRTERTHLKHFMEFLGGRAKSRADSVTSSTIAAFVVDQDGTPSLTDVVNVTNTPRQREVGLDWNPAWINDLDQ